MLGYFKTSTSCQGSMWSFWKHYSKSKTVSMKFRKTLPERRLPISKFLQNNPQSKFLNFLSFTIFRGYSWNVFETDIRGMSLEYSGNITSWLLEFAKRSTFDVIISYTLKRLFHRELFKKSFPLKCSLHVPWMSRTLQRWGNTQRVFPEYCLRPG